MGRKGEEGKGKGKGGGRTTLRTDVQIPGYATGQTLTETLAYTPRTSTKPNTAHHVTFSLRRRQDAISSLMDAISY